MSVAKRMPVLQLGRPNKLNEAHCMDAHVALQCRFCVQPIDGKYDFFNGSAGKFIAKDVDEIFLSRS